MYVIILIIIPNKTLPFQVRACLKGKGLWRAGSPGTLVAVATLQTVLSSDLGSKGEQETTYPQLLKWEHTPPHTHIMGQGLVVPGEGYVAIGK